MRERETEWSSQRVREELEQNCATGGPPALDTPQVCKCNHSWPVCVNTWVVRRHALHALTHGSAAHTQRQREIGSTIALRCTSGNSDTGVPAGPARPLRILV
mgnify:CR=1 FL=1